MAPAIRAREALANFVQFAFGPTDLVALMDQLTPTDAIRFTRDRRALADQVHKLKGRQGVYLPPRSAVEEAQMYRSRDIEMLRVAGDGDGAGVDDRLPRLDQGRAQGDPVRVADDRARRHRADGHVLVARRRPSALANANNTSIYAFDPRGLDMNIRPSDILQSLAEQHRRQAVLEQPAGRSRCARSSRTRARSTCSATRRRRTRRTGSSTRSP